MLSNIPIRPGSNSNSQNNSSSQSGYRSSVLDAAKAKKEKENAMLRERLNRDLAALQKALLTQMDLNNRLIKELNDLKNKTKSSTTVTSETVLNIQTFERQNKSQITQNENRKKFLQQEIKKLEQEILEYKREEQEIDAKNRNLAQGFEQKKQAAAKANKEQTQLANQNRAHDQEVAAKTASQKIAENRVNQLKQDITNLENRINSLR